MERPIGFKAEMVRAILAGRKSQTRRICKDQTAHNYRYVKNFPVYPIHPDDKRYTGWIKECDTFPLLPTKCPYGKVRDGLWVKETWGYVNDNGKDLVYRASINSGLFTDRQTKWKAPRFMPKRASRITLEITDVRVEKLTTINSIDAIKEGFDSVNSFQIYWDKLNDKRGFAWRKNPWVWILEFQRV